MSGEFTVRKQRLLADASGRVLELSTAALADRSLPPGGYETVVSIHALCAVHDLDAAIRRIDELLAPGGKVLVLEHVRAPGLRGRMQDLNTPIWRLAPFGCHANRDVIGALRRNGFAVTDCDRFRERRSLPIVAPHISAVAVRKAQPPVTEERTE